jgi:hypothetical protein
MALDFKDLKDLTVDWLDDPDYGYFTETRVGQRVNRALFEVQKMLVNAGQDYYVKCVTTQTVIDQEIYSYPSDFLKVNYLSLITQGTGAKRVKRQLYPMVRSQQNLLYGETGTPSNYYLSRDYFHLHPIPNEVKTIEMDYTYRVAEMVNDGDFPDCPEIYVEFIAVLAALDGFIKDGRDMTPLLQKKSYYEELMKKNAQQRKVDRARMVNASAQGYGEY